MIVEVYIKFKYHITHIRPNYLNHGNEILEAISNCYDIRYGIHQWSDGKFRIIPKQRNIALDDDYFYDTIFIETLDGDDKIENLLKYIKKRISDLVDVYSKDIFVSNVGSIIVGRVINYNTNYTTDDIKEPECF